MTDTRMTTKTTMTTMRTMTRMTTIPIRMLRVETTTPCTSTKTAHPTAGCRERSSTDSITNWFEGELQQDLSLIVSSTVTQYLGVNILDGQNAIYLIAENTPTPSQNASD
ncbi:unnamed protein product [Closterium sp. NIES-54]